jgi:hypothetical protein
MTAIEKRNVGSVGLCHSPKSQFGHEPTFMDAVDFAGKRTFPKSCMM